MNLLLWYPVCSFFSLTKTFVTSFALFLSTFPLESHCACRSNTTYCDGSFRNHFFFHDLNPWNCRNSSNGVESTSMWFSLLCIGLLMLLFAKWLWTKEILHNKIIFLLYSFSLRANNMCCIQHQYVWETCCSWIIEVGTHSHFSSSLRYLHTMLPQILPSFVKIAYQ